MAEVDEKYIMNQVLTEDEVREMRFGKTGLASMTELTNDSIENIEEYLKMVKENAKKE